jgi:hypothetical protein
VAKSFCQNEKLANSNCVQGDSRLANPKSRRTATPTKCSVDPLNLRAKGMTDQNFKPERRSNCVAVPRPTFSWLAPTALQKVNDDECTLAPHDRIRSQSLKFDLEFKVE